MITYAFRLTTLQYSQQYNLKLFIVQVWFVENINQRVIVDSLYI